MKKGFTLMELLTVVLIVAILSGVALPQYRKVIEKAHVSEAQSILRTIYDSSERLAGEFGYRSYGALVNQKGESNYSFARMDMFDADNLPSDCSLYQYNLLECPSFSYKPYVVGNSIPYVAAKKLNTPYKDTLILFDRNEQQIYCQEAKSGAEACDVFGLDTRSGVSF